MNYISGILSKVAKKYNSVSLILRIMAGLALGVVLGLTVHSASWIGIFGSLFVGALKGLAPILVFAIVSSAMTHDSAKADARFGRVIFLYLLTTFVAAVLSVVMSLGFPVVIDLPAASETPGAAPEGLSDVFVNLIVNLVTNPLKAIIDANYIGILFWAILFGVSMKSVGSSGTKEAMKNVADAISTMVRFVISLAPFGIMGLVYTSVAESGLGIFRSYGKLLLLLVGAMLVQALVVSPIIAFLFMRRNPFPLLFRCVRESGMTAFFTRSSAANIPVNMALCERMGLDKDFYSLSIPLGSTINMNGAAITITIMTLAAANTLGIAVSLPAAIFLSFVAALGACGASGVAGGSLLLIPMACALFGISNDVAMQVVGVGFVVSVIQDSMETALNSSGDVMFTSVAEFVAWQKEGRRLPDFMYSKKELADLRAAEGRGREN